MSEVCAVGELPDLQECGEVQQTRGSIFVGNLPDSLTSQAIRDIFERHKVEVLYVERKIAFAFVHCNLTEDLKGIVLAMKNYTLECGRVLLIEFAKGDGEIKRREDDRKKTQVASATLFIVGFNTAKVSEAEVSKAFSHVATVQKVMIRKCFCFVRFNSVADATKVMEQLHGTEVLGRMLSIEYGMSRPATASSSSSYRSGQSSPSRSDTATSAGSSRRNRLSDDNSKNNRNSYDNDDISHGRDTGRDSGRFDRDDRKDGSDNNGRGRDNGGNGNSKGNNYKNGSNNNHDDNGRRNDRNRSRSRSREKDRERERYSKSYTEDSKSGQKSQEKVRVLYEHSDGRKEYVEAILCPPASRAGTGHDSPNGRDRDRSRRRSPRRSRNCSGERSDHWTDSDNAWSRDRDGRGGGGRKSGESGRGRNGNDRNSDEGSRGDRNKRDTSREERNDNDHSSEKRVGDNNNRGRKHNDNSSSGNGNSNSNGNGNGSGSGRVQETRTTNLERSKPTTDTSRNPFLIKNSEGPRSGSFGFGHKGPSDPGSGDRNGVRGTTGGKTIFSPVKSELMELDMNNQNDIDYKARRRRDRDNRRSCS